ncbi:MAG TPA: UDP-N-acetylglucosamine 2-epimerase [Abditibacteriaceae bacterium]|jgi:UDP-hydrolysing UDP-N-acetyl-D-glucosamine 2-epimerase
MNNATALQSTGFFDRTPRTICVVLVDRANYGRLKPVMEAIANHAELQLQVVVAGTMVLERFGAPVNQVRADGFPVDGEIFLEVEGSNPITMAKSVGLGTMEFANEFARLKPDVVCVIGDRYEALGATLAAAFLNLPIVHLQGGEVSGSIDESTRHAMSKFAHFHVPSTQRAADYLVRMGENPQTILTVGCPSSDLARRPRALHPDVVNAGGSGAEIDVALPFLLVVFHPTTTEWGGEVAQIEALLSALQALQMPTVLLWPNIDAGSDHIAKAIRIFRNQHAPSWLRTLTNLSPEDYLTVLSHASCAIGNSSSFVRDASYFGTPVVLVGNRQEGREHDVHVVPVAPRAEEIERTARAQLEHGRYEGSTLYGDGGVAPRVAEKLAQLEPYVQKRLHYIHDELRISA